MDPRKGFARRKGIYGRDRGAGRPSRYHLYGRGSDIGLDEYRANDIDSLMQVTRFGRKSLGEKSFRCANRKQELIR